MTKILAKGKNMPKIIPRGSLCQKSSLGGEYARSVIRGKYTAKKIPKGPSMSKMLPGGITC